MSALTARTRFVFEHAALSEIVRDLLEIYAFAFFTGYGAYRLIVPAFLRRHLLPAALIPGLGLAQLAIVAGYCIHVEASPWTALLAQSLLSALTLSAAYATRSHGASPIAFLRRLRAKVEARRFGLSVARLVLLTVTLGAVVWPVLHAGTATTPYRIGIDQVGYAESGQFLVEGGTLGALRTRLLSELGTATLALAERQSYKDIHYETYVDVEFLLKASRWGYPGTVAALTLLTGSGHVYRLEFLLLVFGYALSLALVYHFARDAMQLPDTFAFLVVLAVALNCNMLNVYFEGQYAQVFAAPYFLTLLAIYLRARRWDGWRHTSATTLLRSAATFALCTAALFSAYNEALVLVLAFAFVTTVLDLLFYRRTNLVALALVTSAFFVGALLVWPLSHAWIAYSVANLAGLSRAGFWQPHWASLAEMLGVSDMYVTPGYALLPRSVANQVFDVAISAIAAFLIGRFVLRARVLDRSFWLAPLLLVLAEYVKSRYVDDILNYPYMKVYTIFIPLIAVFAFTALYRFAERNGTFLRYAQYVVLASVIVVGSTYVLRYTAAAATVTPEMFALYSGSSARRFDSYAFFTNHADIYQYMFVPLLSMHWLDETASQKYLASELGRPVMMIVREGDVPCRECLASFFAGHIVYEDATQLFIDTGLVVADLCDPKARRQRVDALGYDGQKQWVDSQRLPSGAFTYRQCDFGYPQKLIARAEAAGR